MRWLFKGLFNRVGERTISARNIFHSRSGAAAVEFAIIAPLFFLMLLGMLGFGVYLSATHSVRQLTADAARATIPGLSETERQALASSFIRQNSKRYAFIEPDKLTVEVGASEEAENRFDVKITYDASDLPIWHMGKLVPLPDKTIVSKMTIQNGGV